MSRAKADLPSLNPCAPVVVTKSEVYAVRALQDGKANEGQQQLAWDLIMKVAGVRDLEFRPESERLSAFASGKRFVGLQLVKLITLPGAYVEKLEP